MLNVDKLLSWNFLDVTHAYTATETMLYALSVGLGSDPLDEAQLRFVTDSGRLPMVIPSMSTVIGFPGSWMADPDTGIDFSRIVHGEEAIRLYGALPAEGQVVAKHKVVEVTDKGPETGAVIVYDKDLFDAETGALLASVRHTTFARGNGGFSGTAAGTRTAPRSTSSHSVSPATRRRRVMQTLPQQALLYRLCADRNPLHSDPQTASMAGFERPILHGLCTFGIACHAILADWCGYDPLRLKSFRSRFAAPVFPGDSLLIESWEAGSSIHFEGIVESRGSKVLAAGVAELT